HGRTPSTGVDASVDRLRAREGERWSMSGRGGVRGPVSDTARPGLDRPAVRTGTAEGTQQERGVQRGHDRLPSLVLATVRQPGPGPGVFNGVTSEHSVAHWSTGVQG